MTAYDDAFDNYDPGDDTEGVECKRCGAEGLDWIHTGVRWRLMDGKNFHVCTASPDDFDVVPDA